MSEPFRVGGPSQRGDAHVLRLEGEFDFANVPRFEGAAEALPASERVLLDLRPLQYMDSSGVWAVLCLSKRVKDAGGSLACVMPPDGAVWRLFDLTQLGDLIEVYYELPG